MTRFSARSTWLLFVLTSIATAAELTRYNDFNDAAVTWAAVRSGNDRPLELRSLEPPDRLFGNYNPFALPNVTDAELNPYWRAGQKELPQCSLVRAREIARSMKAASGGLTHPVRVVLREGTYFFEEPLVLDHRDGGTVDCPVTWQSAQGERVIVSGGVRTAGREIAADGVWQAKPPESFGSHYPRQLFVKGRRAVRAQTPNAKAYHIIEGVVDAEDPTSDSNRSGFRFAEGEIESEGITEDTEVVILHRWDNLRLRVASVDANKRAVRFVIVRMALPRRSPFLGGECAGGPRCSWGAILWPGERYCLLPPS